MNLIACELAYLWVTRKQRASQQAESKSASEAVRRGGVWCGSIMVYPFPKTRTDLTEHPFCFLITLLLSWTFYFISFLLYVLSVAHINLILLLVSDWFYYFHSPSMVAKVKFPWKKIPLLLKKEKKMVWNRTKKKRLQKWILIELRSFFSGSLKWRTSWQFELGWRV